MNAPRTGPLAALDGARFAALDGLRGLAIIMVLFVHFIGDEAPRSTIERVMVKLSNYGIWGVDLFFVLSGFLITGILHDAKGLPRYFRNFYVRRTLRIFPLYYGVLLLLFAVLPALPTAYPPGLAESAKHQVWLWSYTSNVYVALAGSWALPFVSHFWSLAVEEHFYLVWPVVVLLSARTTLLGLTAVLAAFALALRCRLAYLGASDVALVALTPCRLDALSIGASLAILVRMAGIGPLARVARPLLIAFPALVLGASAWNALGGPLLFIVLPVRGTLVALSFGALLVVALALPATSRGGIVLHSRSLRLVGKYSYGLYVFHGVIAYWFQDQHVVDRLTSVLGSHLAMIVQAILGSGLSLLVAAASYELFEKHFLRLKDRFAPSATARRAPETPLPALR